MVISSDNPFADSADNPTRRFRGRLASPVTIITSGRDDKRTGLTVSSLFVVDGDPAMLHAVVGPNSDLFDTARSAGRFVVHICSGPDMGLADVFAGLRPSPGGLFATVQHRDTPWGPVIDNLPNRAYCTTTSMTEEGWSGILIGQVDELDVDAIADPLIHFRGSYKGID